MSEQIPSLKSKFVEQEPVFKGLCKKCGGEFSVFITPTVDESKALEELEKIKNSNLCPNCRK